MNANSRVYFVDTCGHTCVRRITGARCTGATLESAVELLSSSSLPASTSTMVFSGLPSHPSQSNRVHMIHVCSGWLFI